jgi:lipoyl(octanoyl) transferase
MKLRVIFDKQQPAAFNMAADRFLLGAAHDASPVVLRLYTWNIPTISLGHMQKAGEVLDFEAMKRDKIGWIQRPTGGRAVLHWNDLTYSIVFPAANKTMGTTIAETYRIVSSCLVNGLGKAGIDAAQHDSPLDASRARTEIRLPCFLAPNRDEIMVAGKKLVGSAQKRTARAVLQHGSIAFTADAYRLPGYLKIPDTDRRAEGRLFKAKCTCIAGLVPGLTKENLARCLVLGFSETLRAETGEAAWTAGESAKIAVLRPAD